MIRLSHHRARDRRNAWQAAADILVSPGTRLEQQPELLESWSACNAHRSLWSRIEHVLWTQRHQPIRNRLTAAVRQQKHRP